MRLEIVLKPEIPLDLPIHYNAHLRAFIYNNFEPSISKYLHDYGYSLNNKKFKMFCFSRLNGLYEVYHSKEKKQQRIKFKNKVSFVVSAIDNEDILQEQGIKMDGLIGLANKLLEADSVSLNNITCIVDSVNIKKTPKRESGNPTKIRLLSPITLHRTFKYSDGRKGTDYHHPFEELWQKKIFNNLQSKAQALGWESLPEGLQESYIKPITVTPKSKIVAKDKGFWIEAWFGDYELFLPDNYFWLAYKAGLGNRNSAGFGLFEIV